MDFKRADFTNATQGGQFISDLMPKYPIYVNLLDKRAQEAIGQPLEASKPAKQLLEAEGFRYQGYIDVVRRGPHHAGRALADPHGAQKPPCALAGDERYRRQGNAYPQQHVV